VQGPAGSRGLRLSNPNGFNAAETFWEFFELNEKPLA
jgi:hypothetical protein